MRAPPEHRWTGAGAPCLACIARGARWALLISTGACGPRTDDDPTSPVTTPSTTDSATTPHQVSDTGPDTHPITEPLPVLVVSGVRVGVPTGGGDLDAVDAVSRGTTVVATWVDVAPDRRARRKGQLYVARSEDGGETFPDPLAVPTPLSAEWSWPRRPRVAMDDQRIAIALAGEINYEDSRIAVFASPREGPLDLRTVLNLSPAPPYNSLIYPIAAFAPDGELWAAWVAVEGIDADVQIARETRGWTVDQPNGEPDQPCDCCPIELTFDPAGRGTVAWRLDYVRDMKVARTDANGIFSEVELATDHGWTQLACPRDGPRLAFAADGTTLLAWTDGSIPKMQGWLARRPPLPTDTWSPSLRLLPEGPEFQARPTIRVDQGGDVWIALETGFRLPYLVMRSADGGTTWGPAHLIESPGGLVHELELVPTERGMRGIGLAESGDVWLVALDTLPAAR